MQIKANRNNRREFVLKSLAATAGIAFLPQYAMRANNLCVPDSGAPLEFIKKGVSNYIVALNPDASPSEHFAASELVHYIQQCTGVTLPVQEGIEGLDKTKNLLVLGYGEVSKSLGADPGEAELGEQGFQINTVGRNLVIGGTSGVGTLYGVYRFLEEYLGIRWYAPGVTKTPSDSNIRIAPVNKVITPGFLYRNTYYTWPGGDERFFVPLGNNAAERDSTSKYGLGYGTYGIAHSYFNYISPEEFFATHPEYFSEIGGVRIKKETQLCLTNPEVFEIVTRRILDKMRERPDLRQYNFSQMDYYNGCQCEKCRAINREYESDGATQFWFVNKLAERTSKEFPEILIGTLAYTYTEKVPRGMKMHPNVAVWLCHMLPCCDSHPIEKCERNAAYKQNAEEWSTVCSHLYIWHYIVDFAHYYNPFPNYRAMAADMRFYKRIGVEGVFAQGINEQGGGGEFSLLRGYYCAKLLWDPDQDADEIIKDFLKGYYGSAWEPLWEYITLLHDEVEKKNIHLHLYVNPGSGHLSNEIVSRADKLFNRAGSLIAGDPVLFDRVRIARMPLDYAKLFPRNGYRIEQGQLIFNGKIGGPADAERFIGQMQEHGFHSIREGYSDPKQLMALSAMFTSVLPVVTLDNESISIDVVPVLSGRILRITEKQSGLCVTAHNRVKSLWFPFTGGQENRIGELYSPLGWTEPAEVTAQTTDSVTTKAELRNGLILERKISLPGNKNTIVITASLINPGEKPVNARLRSHLELDMAVMNGVDISFTDKSGNRMNPKMTEVIAGMREGIHYYSGQVPDGRWSFRSNALEVVQSFNPGQVESALLHAYPEDLNELETELWLFNSEIAGGERVVFEEKIEIKRIPNENLILK